MMIRTDPERLSAALALAVTALPSRPRIPEESVVTLLPETLEGGVSRLTVIGSGPERQVASRIQMEALPDTELRPLVIPGRLVAEWIKGCRKGVTVRIEVADSQVRFSAGRTLTIAESTVDPVQPPSAPEGERPAARGVSLEGLSAALRRVAGAVSRDAFQPLLNGVHLRAGAGVLTISATNRFIIARTSVPGDVDDGFEVVPHHRQLLELVGALAGETVTLVLDGGTLWLQSGDITARMGVLDGDWPDLDRMLERTQAATTTVDLEGLRDEVRSVATIERLASHAKDSRVDLTGTGTGVQVGLDRDGVEVGGVISGDGAIDITVNPGYLLAAMEAVGAAERLSIHHTGTSRPRPLLLDAEGGQGVALLMPIRR